MPSSVVILRVTKLRPGQVTNTSAPTIFIIHFLTSLVVMQEIYAPTLLPYKYNDRKISGRSHYKDAYARPQPATMINMPHRAISAPAQSYRLSLTPSTTRSHSSAVQTYTPP